MLSSDVKLKIRSMVEKGDLEFSNNKKTKKVNIETNLHEHEQKEDLKYELQLLGPYSLHHRID